MCQSECRQLLLCMRFIRGNRPMLAALQKKDWKAFARLYNRLKAKNESKSYLSDRMPTPRMAR